MNVVFCGKMSKFENENLPEKFSAEMEVRKIDPWTTIRILRTVFRSLVSTSFMPASGILTTTLKRRTAFLHASSNTSFALASEHSLRGRFLSAGAGSKKRNSVHELAKPDPKLGCTLTLTFFSPYANELA
jgi:hypothetical protein